MNIKSFIRRWGLFILGFALLLPFTTVYAKTAWDHSRKQIQRNSTVALTYSDVNETAKKMQLKDQNAVAMNKKMERQATSGKQKVVNPSDIELLARAVYSEARGEHFQGQVAIASVIINRSESRHFPHSIRGVIFQKNAFTSVADGQFWLKPDAKAYFAARMALNGADPTNGALFYCNPKTMTSRWMKEKAAKSSAKRIGHHIFMK